MSSTEQTSDQCSSSPGSVVCEMAGSDMESEAPGGREDDGGGQAGITGKRMRWLATSVCFSCQNAGRCCSRSGTKTMLGSSASELMKGRNSLSFSGSSMVVL